MKILVTGASGNVGRWVIQELEKAHELRLFSRRHPKDAQNPFETKHPHIAGDLLDPVALGKALDGVQAVAHLGANPWNSDETFETNVMSTYNLLELCRQKGIKRIVTAGSDWGIAKSDEREVKPDYVPVDESHPCRPTDNYGLSKVVCEQVCEWFAREHGLDIAVLRITSVWPGPAVDEYTGKDKSTAVADAAKYWWTYVDARDVARAFRLAIEAPKLPRFGTYIISAKDSTFDEDTQAVLKRQWPGVPQRGALAGNASVLSTAAAKQAFGWEPIHSWKK